MATIAEMAAGVVTQLNRGTFSQPFTAVRDYRPSYTLEELQTLRVTVMPKAVAIAGFSRKANSYDHKIEIAVQKKLAEETIEEIDALVALTQEVCDVFGGARIDALPGAMIVELENDPVFAPEHIDQQRVFTSLITVTFRTVC